MTASVPVFAPAPVVLAQAGSEALTTFFVTGLVPHQNRDHHMYAAGFGLIALSIGHNRIMDMQESSTSAFEHMDAC